MTISKLQLDIGTKKAMKSSCLFKISVLCFNKRGELLGCVNNRPKFKRQGGSLHAEENALLSFGHSLKTVVLLRTNASGHLLPIHPCERCAKLLDKYQVKVVTIK